MAAHGDGWEEIAGAILHVDSLHGIGVVAHPELVEATEESPVGTTAAAGTTLDNHILVLGADAIHHLGKARMVGDVEMALVGH